MSTFRVLENSELRGPIECYHRFLPSSTRHTKRVGLELRTSTHEGAPVTVSSLTRGLRYLLATCTFTPLYGRLSNVMGRRGANQTAVFFAALGTLACGLSTSMETLIAARFVWISLIFHPLLCSRLFQLGGLGGGGIFTTATYVFRMPLKRAKRRLTNRPRIVTSDMYSLRVCQS